MGTFDTITTDRLLLRRWQESDREPFAELSGDPQTMLYFPQVYDRQASDALIDRAEANFDVFGYGLWALELRETRQFIGFTGLAPMPDDVPGAGGVEVGWRLARRAWHHGYATEAAHAALRVAFDGVGLAEIWSMTAVANEPSQAVMRRLGMTEAARFDHPRVPDGHPVKPHVTYHLAAGCRLESGKSRLKSVSTGGDSPSPAYRPNRNVFPAQGSGVVMTVVEGILLAVSVAAFVYLGVAMFKPEWF